MTLDSVPELARRILHLEMELKRVKPSAGTDNAALLKRMSALEGVVARLSKATPTKPQVYTPKPAVRVPKPTDNSLALKLAALEREVERLRVKESPGGWQSWTPTVTWQGAAPTTTTITAARYCKVGKLVAFNVYLNITRGGGAAVSAVITPPVAISSVGVASGRTTLHGSLESVVCPISPSVAIQAQLITSMSSDGYLIITGLYEVA